MKNEADIRSRIRELVSQEMDRRVQEASSRLPHRCLHNYRHPLDTRKYEDGERNGSYNRVTLEDNVPVPQQIGLCLLGCTNPQDWSGTICDEPLDAKRCPYFTPAKSLGELIPELERDLRDSAWVKENLVELHTLFWVLGWEETQVPWWKKLLFKFKIIKIEKVLPPSDVFKLLI
jgi:hypothetical protein